MVDWISIFDKTTDRLVVIRVANIVGLEVVWNPEPQLSAVKIVSLSRDCIWTTQLQKANIKVLFATLGIEAYIPPDLTTSSSPAAASSPIA